MGGAIILGGIMFLAAFAFEKDSPIRLFPIVVEGKTGFINTLVSMFDSGVRITSYITKEGRAIWQNIER